jgi:hypothetical protein
MGAEKEDEERGASESSGLDDIMELGAAFGADEDEESSPNIVASEAAGDELDNLAAGYGGVAAASLVEADDLAGEAANESVAPAASETAAAKPKAPEVSATPAPKPKPSTEAAKPEPAAEPKAKPKSEAKPAAPKKAESSRGVKTTDADANAAAALVANTAAASQLSEIRRVAPSAPRKEEERGGGMTWLVVAVVLLLLGGGYWFVFMRGANTTDDTANKQAAVAPPEKEEPPVVAKAAPPPEPEPEPEPVVEEKLDLPPVVEEEPEVETDVKKSKRRNKTKDDGKEEAKAEPEPKEPEPEPEPKDEPPPQLTEDQYRTECLLNPNKPGCAEAKRKYGDKYKDLDKTLPDKLSESDVRSAVAPRKSAAKACGAKHGVDPGTVVRVKLSIEGDSGKVMSASAVAPHAGTPVGDCVADALKEAKFRRFKSGQQGTIYPVTM